MWPKPDDAQLTDRAASGRAPNVPPVSADRPLSNPKDDRLGYAPFARALATGIGSMSAPDTDRAVQEACNQYLTEPATLVRGDDPEAVPARPFTAR